MVETILLVGFGHHARRIYYPVLNEAREKYDFIIVDVDNQKESIEGFFAEREHKPKKIILLKQFSEELPELPQETKAILDAVVDNYKIKGMIISTDPLYHLHYAKWALKREISILMDKPISARKNMSSDVNQAEKLNKDYQELYDLYSTKRNKILFSVVSQRRFHSGFQKAKELIKEVFEKTNCPITSIQINHADGQWRLPNEIIDIDYHSFNQGFGKCSHSGYHFIDLLTFLFEGATNESKKVDNVEVFSSFLTPLDHLNQISLEDYDKLFSNFRDYNKYSHEELKRKMRLFGEIDAFINMNFKIGENIITLCSLNLVHNGFSQRGNLIPNKDLYKGNGRVRHESYIIQQGPFQCLHIDSLQSSEIKANSEPNYDIGGEYHFDIHIFRNDKFNSKWKNYEKISIRQLQKNKMLNLSRGHQEDARREATFEFLNYLEGERKKEYVSDFALHKNTVKLIAGIYKSSVLKLNNSNPLVKISYDS
jgi:predicted dehydrogenase